MSCDDGMLGSCYNKESESQGRIHRGEVQLYGRYLYQFFSVNLTSWKDCMWCFFI